MAYFPDLSPCTYFDGAYVDPRGDLSRPPPLLSVGWLDAEHPFTMGDPGRELYECLKVMQAMEWQPLFFFFDRHECELCRFDAFRSGKELFIPGDGVTYAAPEGIVHYIACHGYLPPPDFCDSVMRCPPPDTPEFFAAMQANGWSKEATRLPDPPPAYELTVAALAKAMETRAIAKCAAVNAFRTLRGAYPDTLDDAERATVKGVEWTYGPEPHEGYWVAGEWQVEGIRLVFDTADGIVTKPDGNSIGGVPSGVLGGALSRPKRAST